MKISCQGTFKLQKKKHLDVSVHYIDLSSSLLARISSIFLSSADFSLLALLRAFDLVIS